MWDKQRAWYPSSRDNEGGKHSDNGRPNNRKLMITAKSPRDRPADQCTQQWRTRAWPATKGRGEMANSWWGKKRWCFRSVEWVFSAATKTPVLLQQQEHILRARMHREQRSYCVLKDLSQEWRTRIQRNKRPKLQQATKVTNGDHAHSTKTRGAPAQALAEGQRDEHSLLQRTAVQMNTQVMENENWRSFFLLPENKQRIHKYFQDDFSHLLLDHVNHHYLFLFIWRCSLKAWISWMTQLLYTIWRNELKNKRIHFFWISSHLFYHLLFCDGWMLLAINRSWPYLWRK